MAQNVWSARDLATIAEPELRRLRDVTGETAYLAVLESGKAVQLSKCEGAHDLRSSATPGQRKQLYCTSQGKAMLAFLPDDEREALLRKLTLKALTPNTITDRNRLKTDLSIVRARGFAIDLEEIVEGVHCVGAPVISSEGRLLGSVSIAGPSWRLTVERLELLGPEVAAAGRRIGTQMRSSAGSATDVAIRPIGSAAFHGSSPRWSTGKNHLWWVDTLGPDIRCTSASAPDYLIAKTDEPLKALTIAANGRAVAIDSAGVVFWIDDDGVRARQPISELSRLLTLRPAPDGQLWASKLDLDGSSSVIGVISTDGFMKPVWRLPGKATALAWMPNGDGLIISVPDSGKIFRLDPKRSVPMVLAHLPPGGGRPTGLAVDAAGGIWTALYNGWSLVRLDAEGEVARVIPLPVARPTDICFGGSDLQTLFVTTARHGISLDVLESAPQSGRLLAFEAGVAGVAEPEIDWSAPIS
ncbi:IclR family transcriptional regulator C-terminal domain-containing protein [Bradyrhizobium sp. Cp5.3]|uniref:IclR family transcriptional regulator domain-containing protein n=1 Tax=Bradyrhizobium sp. Cp5.3 TaxID=443598 RepID=UPI001FD8DB61|nr:IclR family transcriptional regulator C-terminal domain-containing protein [Bradyrhizobium sp. Cp5.3]